MHEHPAETVGPTSEPQVVAGPASQPAGGGGGLLFTGVEAPHALSFGTQTLTWSPAYDVSCVHVVLEPHSSPLGQLRAQNVSPWN